MGLLLLPPEGTPESKAVIPLTSLEGKNPPSGPGTRVMMLSWCCINVDQER